jgi:hypothetical protein
VQGAVFDRLLDEAEARGSRRVYSEDASGYDITQHLDAGVMRAHCATRIAARSVKDTHVTSALHYVNPAQYRQGYYGNREHMPHELNAVGHMYFCEQLLKGGQLIVITITEGNQRLTKSDYTGDPLPVGTYYFVPPPGPNPSGQANTGGDNSDERRHADYTVCGLWGSHNGDDLTRCGPPPDGHAERMLEFGTIIKPGSTSSGSGVPSDPIQFTSHDWYKVGTTWYASWRNVDKCIVSLQCKYHGEAPASEVITGLLFAARSSPPDEWRRLISYLKYCGVSDTRLRELRCEVGTNASLPFL